MQPTKWKAAAVGILVCAVVTAVLVVVMLGAVTREADRTHLHAGAHGRANAYAKLHGQGSGSDQPDASRLADRRAEAAVADGE